MTFDPCDLAADLPDARSFDRALLARLGSVTGFDVAFLATPSGHVVADGLDEAMLARVLAPGSPHEREVMPIKRAALSARGVAVDTAVLGEQGVRACSYYRDLMRDARGRHSLLGYARARGQVVACVMLGRTGGEFSHADIALVERLLPRVAVARASYAYSSVGGRPLPRRPDPRGALSRLLSPSLRLCQRVSGDTTLEVRDRGGYRELVASRAGREMVWTRANLERPHRSGWPYVDLLQLATSLAEHRRRALFIGAGGGVAVRQIARAHPGLAIDVVEIDAEVIALSNEYFDLGAVPGARVVHGDGAAFVNEAPAGAYDVIVVDAFAGDELAEGLASRSFFADVHRALACGGAMAFNVVGALAGAGPVRAVARAARTAFRDVRLVPVIEQGDGFSADAARNVVVVARRG